MSAVPNPAPLPITWSEFASKGADSVWRRAGTWPELIERISTASGYATKAACPWVKLAIFGDVRSAGNSLRHDGNVTNITGVEGDYDDEQIQPGEAIEALERAGVKACVYTSPSHTPEKPRWRVLAPLSKPMPPASRSALLARINGVLGGVLAGESFTLSQSYYFGQVDGAEFCVLVTFNDPDEGYCVDELDELDETAIGKRSAPAGHAGGPAPGEDLFAEKVRQLGRRLRTGDGRREMLKAYIASRSGRGMRADDILLLIDGIAARYFDPADPPNPADVRGIVQWAADRDAEKRSGPRLVHPPREGEEDDADADAEDDMPGAGPDLTLMSEDAMALDFATMAEPSYRWSPGLAWMRDDGIVWTRDDALTRYTLAREVARATARQAAAAIKESEARKLATAKCVNAILSLAQSDHRLVVPAAAWDAEPMLLNTPAGIVDLRTGALRPRGLAYVTQAARVAPAAAPCPTWLRFLDQVFLGDRDLIEFIRRALGYSITGDRREQVLFFLYGLGANGKSVLIDLIQWLIGDYALKLPASVLMQSKGERHPTELAQLRGKRLAVSSELDESSFFNESLIKELTGDAVLTARFMRQDFFEFSMSQKHVIVGNFKPRLKGGDPAIARRMLLVPFLASFKGSARDPKMLEKLKAEAPAILHWIVGGAVDWARDGLAVPEPVRAASADYLADNDDLALWMEECCDIAAGLQCKASDAYGSFAAWKKARGEHAPSLTSWGSRITSLPGITKARSMGIRYRGFSLNYAAAEALHADRR